MKCQKCGYVSFDGLERCKKCGALLIHPGEPGTSGMDNILNNSQTGPSRPPHIDNTFEIIKKELEEIDRVDTRTNTEHEGREDVKYAGFSIRLLAYTIDNILLSIISMLVFMAGWMLISRMSVYDLSIYEVVDYMLLPYALLSGFIECFYFVYFHAVTGQTPGKLICGIKVLTVDGRLIGFGRSFIRFLGYFLSMILYIGFLMILFTGKKQGLHDKLAGTVVVKVE